MKKHGNIQIKGDGVRYSWMYEYLNVIRKYVYSFHSYSYVTLFYEDQAPDTVPDVFKFTVGHNHIRHLVLFSVMALGANKNILKTGLPAAVSK